MLELLGGGDEKGVVGVPLTSELEPASLSRIINRDRVLNRGGVLAGVIGSNGVPGVVFCNPSNAKGAAITGVVTGTDGQALCGLGTAGTSITSIGDVYDRTSLVVTSGNILLCLSRVRGFGGGRRRSLLRCVRGNGVALVTDAARGPCFCVCGTVLDHDAIFRFGTMTPRSVIVTVGEKVGLTRGSFNKGVGVGGTTARFVTRGTGKSMEHTLGFLRLIVACAPPGTSKSVTISLRETRNTVRRGTFHCSGGNSDRCSIVDTLRGSVHNSSPSTTVRCLTQLVRTRSLRSTYEQLVMVTTRSVNLTCPVTVPVIGTYISDTLVLKLPRTEVPLTSTTVLLTATPGSGSTCVTLTETVDSVRGASAKRVPERLRGVGCSKTKSIGEKRGCLCPRSCPGRCITRRCLPSGVGGGGCCRCNRGGARRTTGRC